MASIELTPVEARILGCLLEKERVTPENYPLSLNSLVTACNQSTNREPVTSYDERTVENGVNALRDKKLATVSFGAGARVQKYRHNLLDHFELDGREVALLCVLLLRGAQTPGELRARTERLFHFGTTEEVEVCLGGLSEDASPLVRVLPPRPGQKERRYVQLLAGEPGITEANDAARYATSAPSVKASDVTRIEALEHEVARLAAEVTALREELTSFRKQFE